MAYGLIYQGEFSSIAENDYRLEILKKDYTGSFYTLPMAAVPVVQNWGTDEVKPSLKPCNLTIGYLNRGAHPIDIFYSNNDDEYLVKFYQDSELLFIGYLVQDDIREPMLDTTHEVTLTASDNLGLLKEIDFNKNEPTSYTPITAEGDFISVVVPTQNWIYLRNSSYVPQVGVPFTISGHPAASMNKTFTPTVVNTIAAGSYDVRTNTFTGDQAAEPVNINGVGGAFDFYGRNSLLSIMALCLQNTGLELETYIYENLYEDSHNTATCSLAQTYISLQTFISGETFMRCADVLDKICSRFHLTLFQSLGRWNIIRWDELRMGANINGFIYDTNFVLTGTTTLDAAVIFGFQEDTKPITGLLRMPVRPYEFCKELFNYGIPKYILQNYDLQLLGDLLRQSTSGTTFITEYTATSWLNTYGSPAVERFIRKEYDTVLQREADRYLVLRGPTFDSPRALPSVAIDANVDDRISFSCRFRTNISQPSPVGFAFAIMLTDGISTRYLRNDRSWSGALGVNFVLPSGHNTNQWHDIDTGTSDKLPFTGQIIVFLPQFTQAPQNVSKECHFKDMRFEYYSYVNESLKIIGHIHKDLQVLNVKNNEDIEIYTDDSPRNAVKGTLFLPELVGIVQKRTSSWHRDGVTESKKLGEITAIEQLQWRSIVRTRLEGSFLGAKQSGTNISMLQHFTYTQLPGLNFLFGQLSIDYRRDQLNCTATELFQDGEPEVTNEYSFTYLYDTK